MNKDAENVYRELLTGDVPLIDTRSPNEFARGAFPFAVSLPLMTDEERAKVGTCYKHQGQKEAIELGHRLVSGDVKGQRIEAWKNFARTHENAWLYCWRGGLRSETVQQWLRDEGIDCQRVPGGYKALRQYLLREVERLSESQAFVIAAGYTGSGKTELLNDCRPSLDLEGLAQHRGSAFGTRVRPQPTQINFENALIIDLLKLELAHPKAILVEDEGGFIGSCNIPLTLYHAFQASPVVLMEVPFTERVENILKLYIEDMLNECLKQDSVNGYHQFSSLLRSALARIRKRLGNEAYRELAKSLNQALIQTESGADFHAHENWIVPLLQRYYDPMYEYQLQRSHRPIIFRGNTKSVIEWWQTHTEK